MVNTRIKRIKRTAFHEFARVEGKHRASVERVLQYVYEY